MVLLSCLIINNVYIKRNLTIISILSHPKHSCTFKDMKLCSKRCVRGNRYFLYGDILLPIIFILGDSLVTGPRWPVYLIIKPHLLLVFLLIVKYYFHSVKPFFIKVSPLISVSAFRTGMWIGGFYSYFCLEF